MQPFDVVNEHDLRNICLEIKQEICDVAKDSDEVTIIDYSHHFSPYKSQLEREFAEEDHVFEKSAKRSRAIRDWKWDEVIDVDEVSDAYDVIDVDLTNDERAFDHMLDNQVTPPTNFIASRD